MVTEGKKNPKNDSSEVIEHRAYPRVGLLGNPSDVCNGRTISFCFANFSASVRLQPSDHLCILPRHFHDLVQFDSLSHMVSRLESEGYYGVRLIMAICKVFNAYCRDNGIKLHEQNFTLSYDTNIPRQTGLSGSSAIVCAALNCLDFYEVRHLIKVEVRPNLILNAEKELGIVAGLQDRAVQVYGGLVYMDFSKKFIHTHGHWSSPPLHLMYAQNPSDSGKHSSQRWLDGDEFIKSSMEEVAKLPLEGRSALTGKDQTKLAMLMNCNFESRRNMFGDDALGALNIAASKFTGSGGAVAVLCPDGPSQVKLLEDACHKASFIIEPIQVVPSCLSEDELKILDPN